jgi:multidrug resistance efflux pump
VVAGLVLLFAYVLLVWLVFFKFRWLKFSPAWGVVSGFVGLHLLIIFMIGLRFVTPYATEARIIQHTIQLIPRLPEPTLLTEVLVQPNVPVKKGAPLFQFDRRPYEFKLRQLQAQLAAAEQDVFVKKGDVAAAAQKVVKLKAEPHYAQYRQALTNCPPLIFGTTSSTGTLSERRFSRGDRRDGHPWRPSFQSRTEPTATWH